MNTPEPSTLPTSKADSAVREVLMELAGYGLRIARVAAEMAEVEGRVASLLASGLPDEYGKTSSQQEGQLAALAVDAADLALKQASPRIEVAGQTFERVSRAVRRTVALVQRIEAGWPRRGGSDDRRGMARRQIVRGVGERIARHADGEAAERLFDDLYERLDAMEFAGDLDWPVDEMIDTICRAIGLPEPWRDRADVQTMPGHDGDVGGVSSGWLSQRTGARRPPRNPG